MVNRGFKVTVSFCSIVRKGSSTISETVKDERHKFKRIDDGPCHNLIPLEVQNYGDPDYVTWQYQTKASDPHKLLHGPASLKSNRVIVYPCKFKHCFVACPCWICFESKVKTTNNKYKDHLLYHLAPHLCCEFCQDLLKLLSSPTYMKFKVTSKGKDIKICSYIFHHSFSMNRTAFRKKYYTSEKAEARFKCEDCGKQFTQACSLSRHYMNQHYGSKFQCPECLKVYSRKDNLKKHRRTIHLVKFYESDDSTDDDPRSKCLKTTTASSDKLTNELEDCVTDKQHEVIEECSKYKCETCDKKFGNMYHLKRHINLIHEASDRRTRAEQESELGCPLCEKCFQRNYHLQRHIKLVHDQTKEFSCTWCGMKFSLRDHLIKHRNAGLNEKDEVKYRCEECDKIHCTLRSLQRHNSQEHGHGQFQCEICEKSYSKKFNLKVHRQRLKVPCDLCNSLFCNINDKAKHLEQDHV